MDSGRKTFEASIDEGARTKTPHSCKQGCACSRCRASQNTPETDIRAAAGNLAMQGLQRKAIDMPFPYSDRILQATGTSFSLRSIRDALGCAHRGTPAFTDGTVTHFASETPGLHVAA